MQSVCVCVWDKCGGVRGQLWGVGSLLPCLWGRSLVSMDSTEFKQSCSITKGQCLSYIPQAIKKALYLVWGSFSEWYRTPQTSQAIASLLCYPLDPYTQTTQKNPRSQSPYSERKVHSHEPWKLQMSWQDVATSETEGWSYENNQSVSDWTSGSFHMTWHC